MVRVPDLYSGSYRFESYRDYKQAYIKWKIIENL